MHDAERAQRDQSSFKVIDRRRFTAEGTTRPGSESLPDSRPDTRAILSQAAPETGQPPHTDGKLSPQSSQSAPRAPVGPDKKWRSQADFLGFVANLATSAMAALGMLPEAEARGMPLNPAMAREYIEIIAMLEERTEGNVTQEEAQALKRLLSDLRLQYVEVTRQVQPAG